MKKSGWANRLSTWAGPAVIALSVVVVLREFAFGGKVSSQHPDLLAYFLPNHCFLGRSLAQGVIPGWNPFVMTGVPFAADPQSGWMYLPAMALYTLLPCGRAASYFTVLQPLLAGLALYAFLRTEKMSRAAATIGGLVLAMVMSSSWITAAVQFSAALAWSAVLLACAARVMHARQWSRRLLWMIPTGLAWSQLAAAHLSNGLIVGTAALVAYIGMASWRSAREGAEARSIVLLLVLMAFALPALSLAYLLPRIGYLPETSLALGYERLREVAGALSGNPQPAFEMGRTIGAKWPLALATSPGAYAGAAALLLSPASLWDRRTRPVGIAFWALGLACYLLSIGPVARTLAPVVGDWAAGDAYLHASERFRYGVLLALAVTAAAGIDAWRVLSPRRRAAAVAFGAALWIVAPLAAGAPLERMTLLAAGAVTGGAVLLAATGKEAWMAALPVVLGLELGANALIGQAAPPAPPNGLFSPEDFQPLVALRPPHVDASDYVRDDRISHFLRREPGHARVMHLDSHSLNAMILRRPRPMLSRVEQVEGYNPAQLLRFWKYSRGAGGRAPAFYNKAFFDDPTPQALDLLQVGWIVTRPRGTPPVRGAEPALRHRDDVLHRLDAAPRASVVGSWTPAASEAEALRLVTEPGFDPERTAIVEVPVDVNPTAEGATGSATYRADSTQSARVHVDARAPSLVLVRNAHEDAWRAEVDGRPAPVLRADYFLQAVPVPPGEHTVVLRYEDRTIAYGLWGSGLSIALLGAVALALRPHRAPSHAPPVHRGEP